MGDELVAYFGYGSLVNKHTLRTTYIDVIPAQLSGWSRHWQGRTTALEHDVALLSVHPKPDCTIDGMVVLDKLENLPKVDEREAGYVREVLSKSDLKLSQSAVLPESIYIYVAERPKSGEGGPLLQSYLDAVLQGFRNEFGSDGVERFMETTIGFNRPIIADRDAPLYPRSVQLTGEEIALFDEKVRRAGTIQHIKP